MKWHKLILSIIAFLMSMGCWKTKLAPFSFGRFFAEQILSPIFFAFGALLAYQFKSEKRSR